MAPSDSGVQEGPELRGQGRELGLPKSGLKTVVDATVSAVKWVGQKTGITQWAREKARQAAAAAYQAKVYLTKKARQAASFAAQHNPIPAIVAATKPLIAVAKAIVTADPNLPAIIVGAAVQVVSDVAKTVDTLREEVVKQVGSVVETVKDSVDWGEVWDGVKTVGNIVGDVTGFNDIKACVTTGDMESCAWAAATVAGIVLGGAGAAAVRAAKAGRMAAKAAKCADEIAKAAEKGKKVLNEVESVAECVSTARDVASLASGNSFVPGTEVVMADGSRKPIEKVEEGDEVLATAPTTGRTSKQKVTDTIKGSGEKHLVKLTLDTDGPKGHSTDTVTATEGHPFWVPSLKKWLKAGDLKPGEWLRTGSGTRVQIEAVSAWTQQAAVYNLTVDTAHTYYVSAGATPVLVHNCGERKYEAGGKHGREARGSSRGENSAEPADGQGALDNSVQIKATSPRRVGVDPSNGDPVILDRTGEVPCGCTVKGGRMRSSMGMSGPISIPTRGCSRRGMPCAGE
ncbi:polymorphic toxin-type HINT domain-containing protein [Streptomyces sp. NPDC048297]|uniref:polymorphic toxin-type HINT domain-containing protein n=1 Tax=Streptomyces sp. NPDC048297 TaxID=3365531 RepID=UPI00371EB708